jgi:APA family basic amino acid/polyamine antiporter
MARRAGSSLRRDLGILGNFAFAYGDVSEGIYFTLGLVLVYANAAATYAYIFATVAYVLTALCYAELSSAYHQAGGAFIFANRAFGRNIAFLAAWALLLDYLVTTAISAVAAVGYVGYFFPLMSQVATLVTVLVVVGLLVLNLVGIAGSARFSYMLVLFNLVGVAIVLAIGFAFAYHPALNPPAHIGTAPSYPDFLYAVTIAMSSYLGIEVVSQSAGETKKAGTNIPRAVFLISVVTVAATLAFSTLALGVVPYQAMQSNPTAVNYPVSFITSMLPYGWVLGGLTALLGISVLLVAANAGVVGISRMVYSMSEGGVIPKIFARVHSRYRTPFVAIIVFSSLAAAIVVVFSAQLDVLAEMYNFGALIAYMIVGLSLISLRNKEKNLVRPFRTPWSVKMRAGKPDSNGERRQYEIPVLAVGCFTADLIIWLLVVILHPIGREVGTLWIVLGLMLYYLYSRIQRRRSPKKVVDFPGSATASSKP